MEFASWACIAAGVVPGDTQRWDHKQAVLGGLMVRFYKLTSGVIDQTCQHRREITFVLARLAFECLINIHYLIQKNSDDLYRAYMAHSLRHERRLHDRIQKNIRERHSIVLPIEDRMLYSIDNSFRKSGISIHEVTKDAMRAWTDVDLYQRADAVGLGGAYLYIFAGPSHAVHGSWQDLLEYHLEEVDGGFVPQLEWRHPRPQMLFALGIMGIEMLKAYISHFSEDAANSFIAPLDDLSARFHLANSAHEAFLSGGR